MSGRYVLIALLAVLSSGSGLAQSADSPVAGSVWLEQVFGNPEQRGAQTGRGLRQITGDNAFYSFVDGQYKSVLSRMRLKLPRIEQEETVTVREAAPMRRPDGEIATAHLVILPGSMSPGPVSDNQAISAVVVTRLRDDRSKDRETILRQWEPPNEQERARMRREGIEHSRVQVPGFGEAVHRVVRNRASIDPFPYRINVLNSRSLETVGITRIVVVGEDSLIEFSQVVPCAGRDEAACFTNAIAVSDRFISGVTEFLTLSSKK